MTDSDEAPEIIGQTDEEIEELVETAERVVDDGDGSLQTEAAEAGRKTRHRELTMADPSGTKMEVIAHQIHREVRDAVETTIFEGLLDCKQLPSETELTPDAVDRIRSVANDAAEPVVEFVSPDESDVADRLAGDTTPSQSAAADQQRWDQHRIAERER